jgi:ABC-type sugar transport system substrate-binding protein
MARGCAVVLAALAGGLRGGAVMAAINEKTRDAWQAIADNAAAQRPYTRSASMANIRTRLTQNEAKLLRELVLRQLRDADRLEALAVLWCQKPKPGNIPVRVLLKAALAKLDRLAKPYCGCSSPSCDICHGGIE